METRLSRFCDAIIEAGWLAALIIVPLFFNVYSSRVFEPDKIGVLRSIAIVMAGAWLVRTVEAGFPGEPEQPFTARLQAFVRTPLVLPTMLVVLAYLISTALSIAPRISLWGSYPRLQGTFSTFSYIVIFLLVLGHLRRRAQLDRIIFAIIVTSLPIALYGILQHYNLDPLPWGGDVSTRISANMGNPIFVAAYYLMAFFLTLERLIYTFGRLMTEDEGTGPETILAGCYLFILAVLTVAIVFTQSRGPWLGWAGGMYVFILLGLVSLRQRSTENILVPGIVLAFGLGILWIVLALLGIAFIGSKGFLIGAALGLAATFLIYMASAVARRGWSWLWLSWLVLAVTGMGFLGAFNLGTSQTFRELQELPYIGNLGRVLEMDRGTGRVRALIWEGTAKMVVPHESLIYPDGHRDPIGPIRPLVGYGPEAMWVAFNPFYPPDLAHLESRNASPDRSHNETFDSLVITGYLGFAAYFFLFASIFYYALRWLGLLVTAVDRTIFISLALIGGILGAVIPIVLEGTLRLIGVGIPVGFILGFVIFVTIAAVRARGAVVTNLHPTRMLFVVALLSTVVAHFIEINFGIAIAATRTYFWILAGILVVIGTGRLALTPEEESQVSKGTAEAPPMVTKERPKQRRSKRGRQREAASRARGLPDWGAGRMDPIWPYVFIGGLVMLVLAWNYVINQGQLTNTLDIFWRSLTTTIPPGGQSPVSSAAILWLILFTALVGTLMAVAGQSREGRLPRWRRHALLYSLVSGLIFLLFGLWQAHSLRFAIIDSFETLTAQADTAANHILRFYWGSCLMGLAVAFTIWAVRSRQNLPLARRLWASALASIVAIVAVVFIIITRNVNIVRADIYYKQGLAHDSARQYGLSSFLYSTAIAVTPDEDYYDLFLGRALLEQARRAQDTPRQLPEDLSARDARSLSPQWVAQAGQEDLLNAALVVLHHARDLNPLNTDHTANLGRLYRAWGELTADPDERMAKFQQASEFYRQAALLSAHAAHLQNEWAIVYMRMGELEQAETHLARSLELDQEYDQTYFWLGELAQVRGEWVTAEEAYTQALAINPNLLEAFTALAGVYSQQGNLTEAINALTEVVLINPGDVSARYNLAILYQRIGDLSQALSHAQLAWERSPESQREPIGQLITNIQQQLDNSGG